MTLDRQQVVDLLNAERMRQAAHILRGVMSSAGRYPATPRPPLPPGGLFPEEERPFGAPLPTEQTCPGGC